MRILILVSPRCEQDSCSSEATAETAAGLVSRGHIVVLICGAGVLAGRLEAAGVKVRVVAEEDFDSRLTSELEDGRFDIIHACSTSTIKWGLRARERLRAPLFLTIDNSGTDGFEEAWPQCEAVFASCQAIQNQLIEIAPEAAARIHVMPAIVALPHSPRHAPTASSYGLRVLVVSRLDVDAAGAVEKLLRLWSAQLQRGETRIQWDVVGTRSVVPRAQEAADRLNQYSTHPLVRFHDQTSFEALVKLQTECHITMSSGAMAAAALARGIPTMTFGPDGCVGLVTDANYWDALHSDFECSGPNTPLHSPDALDTLLRFIPPTYSEERQRADCAAVTRSYFSRPLLIERLLSHYASASKGKTKSHASPFMPASEARHLTCAYAEAEVILEYGSGGSTEIAARMPGKYVMSVESDFAWARDLRWRLSVDDVLSRPIIHYADVGPTGPWGRPLDDQSWRNFHRYPNEVWEQSWFRHPDLVLIDGRFRTACLAAVILRAEKPIRVLFDDYGVRPLYHQVEAVIEPVRLVGRMAEFYVEPGMASASRIGLLLKQFFWVSLHGMRERDYQSATLMDAAKGSR